MRALRCAMALMGIFTILTACGGGGSDTGTVPPGFVGTAFYQIAAGDLNDDGLNDIAAIGLVQDGNSTTRDATDLHVILQDPASPGHFSVRQRLALSSVFGAVAIADLNGDMRQDIVVTEPGADDVRVILQHPADHGRFSLGGTYPVGPGVASIETADVDLDGLLDLIVTIDSGVVVLLQDGDEVGTFPSELRTIVDSTLFSEEALPVEQDGLAVGDLNADGLLDVATVRWDFDGARIYYHDPAFPSTFLPAAVLRLELDIPAALTLSDLNRDGLLDIVAAGANGLVFPQPAVHLRLQDAARPGTFLPAYTANIDDNGQPIRVVAADSTDDGMPDVLIAKQFVPTRGFAEVLDQTGPPFSLGWLGVFPVLTLPGVEPYLRGFAVADLDGDGLQDVAAADGQLSLLLNDPGDPGQLLPARRLLN